MPALEWDNMSSLTAWLRPTWSGEGEAPFHRPKNQDTDDLGKGWRGRRICMAGFGMKRTSAWFELHTDPKKMDWKAQRGQMCNHYFQNRPILMAKIAVQKRQAIVFLGEKDCKWGVFLNRSGWLRNLRRHISKKNNRCQHRNGISWEEPRDPCIRSSLPRFHPRPCHGPSSERSNRDLSCLDVSRHVGFVGENGKMDVESWKKVGNTVVGPSHGFSPHVDGWNPAITSWGW